MTEQEWLACADVQTMLDFVLNRASKRKLGLFGVACCRRAWHLMTDPRHRRVVEAAEQFADGRLSAAEFTAAMEPVVALWADLPPHPEGRWEPVHYMTGATRHLAGGGSAPWAASYAARSLACQAGAEETPEWSNARRVEGAVQCEILRDLFGYPARPFHFDPDWLSGRGTAAVELARMIYEEGRFAEVYRLADVLEEAGCADAAVLDHCRRHGGHFRGCWVVDALIGKESAVCAGLTTEADWQACTDPEPLLHFLRDKGSIRKWRLFAVACCQRIEHLIRDERSRRAVEVASRHADGSATEEEMQTARDGAERAVAEAHLEEYEAEAEANFCLTPQYVAVCCHLSACAAARSTLDRDPCRTDAEPGSHEADHRRPSHKHAVEAVGDDTHAAFGSTQGDSRWEECQAVVEAARARERRAHCVLLRDVFGEYFGPPGSEGCWLPFGPDMGLPWKGPEQWCLLPTPRNGTLRREWLTWNDGIIWKLAQLIYDGRAFDRLPILADALEEAGCTERAILDHCRLPGEHMRGCWVVDLLLDRA